MVERDQPKKTDDILGGLPVEDEGARARRWFRPVSAGVMLIGVVLVALYNQVPQKESVAAASTNVSSAPKPLRVSAEALYSAYERNEVGADNTYKGRRLLVLGSLRSVTKDVWDRIHLSLAANRFFGDIDCIVRGSGTAEIASLTPGESVVVIGTGDGKFGSLVVLKDCFLSNSE
jgi:hypothetical protein